MSDSQVIAAFAAARKSQSPLSHLPEATAPDLDRAFHLQCAVTKELGWEQAGWKIGCTSERAQKALNAAGPFPGTMFTNRVYRSGEMFPTIAENKRVVEPEVCFTMAKGLAPRGREYSIDEVMAAVAHVCVAIEVVNPRGPKGFSEEVPWFIVDGGLNEGIVLGEAKKPLSRAQYSALRGQVWWNGREMQGGVGSNALGGGDLALTWLANHLNGHGLGLKEGEIITTGVITEFFSAGPGDDIEVTFEHLGIVTVKF
ncbi:MAG: fumarylacetoacetate hydrolase family protein [Aestuariivirga sp.]|uniref:2-keto-4-pentenoate hydratase n=1 Tax=Aestuariivirga sp. TaxID=2650926 RepID=UPI003016BE44